MPPGKTRAAAIYSWGSYALQTDLVRSCRRARRSRRALPEGQSHRHFGDRTRRRRRQAAAGPRRLQGGLCAWRAGRPARSIPVSAGQIYRFVHEMRIGDFVIYPRRSDRTLRSGEIVEPYMFEPDPTHAFAHSSRRALAVQAFARRLHPGRAL